MKKINNVLLLLAVTLISFSCKKNNQIEPENSTNNTNTSTTNLIKIGETYILGAKAKAVVYSAKAFETGYNEVYVSLFDSVDGTPLNAGHFDIIPIMNTGSMLHSCPVENTEDTTATNGYFKSAVVFSMPGTSSEWSLKLTFHNHKNGFEGEGSLGVSVIASTPSKFKSVILSLDSNKSVFISLVQPKNPQVGVNDFEITLHQKTSMMSFPSINNYSVEIVPEMPSMGHGSPNNINPINIGNGHYVGKVNFTMTGLWYVHLNIYKNDSLISNDQFFEMTLQ